MPVRIRRATTPEDVISTVDISIPLQGDISPFLATNWMCEPGLSSCLIQDRINYVSRTRCRVYMLVAYVPSVVPGAEDIVGYMEVVRPRGGGYNDLGAPRTPPNEPDIPDSFYEFARRLRVERGKYRTEDEWRIVEIGVLQKYQRRGIGSLLMAEFLKEVDASNAGAFVSATANARHFFEKFGFVSQATSTFDLGAVLPPWVVHQMKRPAKSRPWWSDLKFRGRDSQEST